MMRRARYEFSMRSTADLTATKADRPRLELKRQVPPLSDRDEAIFLLHTAAEIEHALLAQYLYAAFSLSSVVSPQREWRAALIAIAREEMGHLISVQNVLTALGGPLNFEREDHPFNSFYPFIFELTPFSVRSAARYVLAEMPDRSIIPSELGIDWQELEADAGLKDDAPINRVGLLFEKLGEIVAALVPSDFDAGSVPWQATDAEWRASTFNMIVRTVASREEAQALLADIGAQGEAPLQSASEHSHFRRFYALYQQLRQANPAPSPMPDNPCIDDPASPGYIANKAAAAWALVFDLRYRCVLQQLAHGLLLRNDAPVESAQRVKLRQWSLTEMTAFMPPLAEHIARLPRSQAPGDASRAGPPFALPHTLNLPPRDIDRWKALADLARHSLDQIELAPETPRVRQLKKDMRQHDQARLSFIEAQIKLLSAP